MVPDLLERILSEVLKLQSMHNIENVVFDPELLSSILLELQTIHTLFGFLVSLLSFVAGVLLGFVFVHALKLV